MWNACRLAQWAKCHHHQTLKGSEEKREGDIPRRFDAVAAIVVDMQHCVGIGSVGVLKEKGVLIGGSLLR